MVSNEPMVIVYTTAPDLKTAKAISKPLVEMRLAACVNILPNMVSVYRWKGNVTHDEEVVLIIKTRKSLADDVVRAIIARHPYDVPSIMVVPVTPGSKAFADWVEEETTPSESGPPET